MVDFLVWMLKGGREGGTQLDRGDGAGGGRGAYLEEEGRCTQSVPSSRMDFPGGQRGWQVWGTEGQSQEGTGSRWKFETKLPQEPKAPSSPSPGSF